MLKSKLKNSQNQKTHEINMINYKKLIRLTAFEISLCIEYFYELTDGQTELIARPIYYIMKSVMLE